MLFKASLRHVQKQDWLKPESYALVRGRSRNDSSHRRGASTGPSGKDSAATLFLGPGRKKSS